MKELSFLMFLIALTAIVQAFCNRVFRLAPKRLVFFYFPDNARFNIIWGFVFYAGYGLIIAKHLWLRIGFIAIIVLLIAYLIYLYSIKSFLSGHYNPFNNLISLLMNIKLDAQKKLDKQIGDNVYAPEKSLKIMGLAPFAINRPDILHKRLQMFKNIQSSMKIKHSYLKTVIENLENSLNIR